MNIELKMQLIEIAWEHAGKLSKEGAGPNSNKTHLELFEEIYKALVKIVSE